MSSWISPRAALFAEHFDLEHTGPLPGELEFLLRRIEEGGEPVLELGCGTGRVLVPLLERGIDVSGVDLSPAMLERCRAKCAARELAAELHVQSMEALALPRKFGTVFLGSCGLGILDCEADVRATLSGVLDHLESGGVFSLELETPPASVRSGVWTGGWNATADGSVLARRLIHDYDPDTHIRTGVMIFERYTDGRLADTELHQTRMRYWEVDAVTTHLQDAGFIDVSASKVFTDDQLPDDHPWLIVRARRP